MVKLPTAPMTHSKAASGKRHRATEVYNDTAGGGANKKALRRRMMLQVMPATLKNTIIMGEVPVTLRDTSGH